MSVSPRASRSPTTARPARLQYGLTGRAAALGWPASRVMVIDEDLGRSAANAAERPGFARLVAEITMGHVGLVLGLEMSRLARAGRDWHQLTGAVLAGRGAAGRRGRGLRSELV
jgi:DNA invertase Pin-like site-specific DNA recombinase